MSQKKICQIAPYGGVDHWLNLGLKEFPDTKRLIILVNEVPLKKGEKDYVAMARDTVKKLNDKNKKIPPNKRVTAEIFYIKKKFSFYELIYVFRSLFYQMEKEGYEVYLNITNGLHSWIMALYVAALDFDNVTKIFSTDKRTGELFYYWKYREITGGEREILNILAKCSACSLTEIQKEFFSRNKKGNISFISRLVKKMEREGLVSIERVGRVAYVKISEAGRAYSSPILVNGLEGVLLEKEV